MRSLLASLLGLALGSSVLLLTLDVSRGFRESEARRVVSSLPLGAIAVACLLYHVTRRPSGVELLKRVLLSTAFLFWAADQLFPTAGWAPVANDVAIALFVLDLAVILWSDLRPRLPEPS